MTERVPSLRIVIVDDSAGFRALLVDYLQAEENFDVVGVAADGEAAEFVIDITDPDVVILDVHLPGESGLEVLEKVRTRHGHTMFVLSSCDDTISAEAARLGADLCVDKLVPIDELCDAIRASAGRA